MMVGAQLGRSAASPWMKTSETIGVLGCIGTAWSVPYMQVMDRAAPLESCPQLPVNGEEDRLR